MTVRHMVYQNDPQLNARNYRIVGILWRFSGTSVSCGVVVISLA